MRPFTSALLAVGLAATAVTVAPVAALAADDPFAGLPTRARLLSVKVAKPSPSNCFGESLHPGPFGNHEVSGPAATRCDRFVPQISVEAQLWERRFWGWDRVGTPTSQRETNESDVGTAAFGRCKDNHMRTTGRHSATDVDFDEYTARTSSGGVDIDC